MGRKVGRVGHAERVEDALLHEGLVALAGDDLDDASEGGDAEVVVAPGFARLGPHRLTRAGCDGLGERVRVDVETVGRAVGNAGCVRSQIGQSDQALGRTRGAVEAGAIGSARVDDGILELGDVLLDRVGERNASFVDKQQEPGHGDGLGAGHDLLDRVRAHGLFGGEVLVADRIKRGDFAVTGDECDDAGGLSLIDELLHSSGDVREAVRVHSGAARVDVGSKQRQGQQEGEQVTHSGDIVTRRRAAAKPLQWLCCGRVAQLDRATAFEAVGRRFESCRARH